MTLFAYTRQNVSKRLIVQRLVSALLIGGIACHLLLLPLAGSQQQLQVLSSIIVSVTSLLLVLYFTRVETFKYARTLLLFTFIGFFSHSTWLWQFNYQTHWFLLLGIFIASYLFNENEQPWLYLTYTTLACIFLGFEVYFYQQNTDSNDVILEQPARSQIVFSNAVLMMIACLSIAASIRRLLDSHWQEVYQRTSKLMGILDRVFPSAFLPDEDKQCAQTQYFGEVTVLFIDMSCYSDFAASRTVDSQVAMLHSAYSQFDQILSEYGGVRVKTNGDQYIAAIGIPCTDTETSANTAEKLSAQKRAEQLCRAAIEIQSNFDHICRSFDFKSHLKMGMASGAVTAGFIGRLRPSFDLWGKPMIVASRLEQSCPLNHIQLCSVTYRLLENSDIVVVPTGQQQLKGLPRTSVYRIVLD